MPNFETFTKRLVPLSKRPFVTVQKRGTISMNKAAFAAMGSPAAVELLYDTDAQIIGFRPVDATVEHAYAPRGVGPKSDPTTYIVAATAFTKHYNIPIDVSRRWAAEVQDGVLCVDISNEGTVVTSNRSNSSGQQSAD